VRSDPPTALALFDPKEVDESVPMRDECHAGHTVLEVFQHNLRQPQVEQVLHQGAVHVEVGLHQPAHPGVLLRILAPLQVGMLVVFRVHGLVGKHILGQFLYFVGLLDFLVLEQVAVFFQLLGVQMENTGG